MVVIASLCLDAGNSKVAVVPGYGVLQVTPQGMEIDTVEEVLEMLAYLTYYGPGISDALWSLWPRLHTMLVEWGIQVGGWRGAWEIREQRHSRFWSSRILPKCFPKGMRHTAT